MFNPFGFKKDFDWNDRFGMYIVGGGELGWIILNGEFKEGVRLSL